MLVLEMTALQFVQFVMFAVFMCCLIIFSAIHFYRNWETFNKRQRFVGLLGLFALVGFPTINTLFLISS